MFFSCMGRLAALLMVPVAVFLASCDLFQTVDIWHLATGTAANSPEAARLADLAKTSDRRILCSAAVIDRADTAARRHSAVLGSTVLRGRAEAADISAPGHQLRRRSTAFASCPSHGLSGSSEFSTCLPHQHSHSTVAWRCAPGLSASSLAIMAAKNTRSWLASRHAECLV
jgi:hypothetical protein